MAALQRRGQRVVIGDVRKLNAYQKRHIKGALSLPRKEVDAWRPKLKPTDTVVLYCTCPHDETSLSMAHKLRTEYKLPKSLALKGGLDAWIAAGLPFELAP